MSSQEASAANHARTEAFADASETHYADETRPVSTPGEGSGVSVEGARQDFSELERRLTQQQAEERSSTANSVDVEKAEEEPFNLQDWLTGYQEKTAALDYKRKALGVSWSNLDVRGAASAELNVPTIPSMALWELIDPFVSVLKMVGINPMKPKQRKLLQGFNGHAKPGEMVLVIGRPGSGCSTFLKTIANKRNGFIGVDGEVNYGGIPAKTMAKRYFGEVVYSEEDDLHHATLSVARTTDFALRLKAPAKGLPEHTRKEFRKEMRDMFLKAFNIAHTKHTLVGSATVRGVSGGERKRVSIIETLATGATVIGWDNSSRGLDASTALDYTKSMRVLTDTLESTTFISLYQASEAIWELFDRVLVIDNGRCVYYGPRTEARQYFMNLGFQDRPRSTSADWITGCTDKYERIFQEGRDESNVPCDAESLEQAYKDSSIYEKEMADKEAFDTKVQGEEKARAEEFKLAVREQKHKGVRHRSQYTVPYHQQVYALWLRQMQMILSDRFDIFMSYFTSITLGLLLGGIFFNLPTTTAGLFTRGGVLFIMLLFNALGAFAELPSQLQGRPILSKQVSFAFYRPSALTLSGLFADLPLGVPRLTIFVIIVYFMSHLARNAGAFFINWIIVLLGYYAFRGLFSFFGAVTSSFYTVGRLAAAIIIALVLWAGYVIPQQDMARWNYWISYINPVFFAFEALMVNEFMRVTFTCEGAQIVPSGPGYPAGIGANQVCNVQGAVPGQDFVTGTAYVVTSFGYLPSHLGRNIGILIGFLVGFVVLAAICNELRDQGAFSSGMLVKAPPGKEFQKLNQRLEDRRSGSSEMTEATLEVEGQSFTWSDLQYTVPVQGGKRKLLDHVNGFVKPGTMTALMGASGAGKTTLLDVLADRKTMGVIEGDRLIEGKNIDLSFQRQCGYAEQQDIHEPMCTVREALRFSAYLRQGREISIEEKNQYVEDIIELLELTDLADAIVGNPGFGLGVGDRKRVTIGVELAAKPKMLLFLDEPTSGLDGQSAFTICRLLRKLADNGQTILCTIHQPSALLFETFDRLLLLERGGKTVYFGPIGKDGKHLIKYFADRGAQCPDGTNPAEYMLDAIGAGSQPRVGNKDWADHYLESDLHQDNLRQIKEIDEAGRNKPVSKDRQTEYAATFLTQFRVVLKRSLLSTWRQPAYQYTRFAQHVAFALLTGLIFLRLGNSYATLQYRIFVIFTLNVLVPVIMTFIMPFWIQARSIWIREETSKTFSGVVFASTQIIGELPYSLVSATVFFVLIYYVSGFQSNSNRAGYFYAVTILTELFSISLGTMIASFCKNAYQASLFVPFLAVIMAITCGVIIPPQNMTNVLYSNFLYNINPLRFIISPLVANELHGLVVRCKKSELIPFSAPNGETCAAWADRYIQSAGGYLADPNSMGECHYCPAANGDQFYAAYGISFNERGRDAGIVIAFIAFNIIVTLACTKFIHFSNR